MNPTTKNWRRTEETQTTLGTRQNEEKQNTKENTKQESNKKRNT